MCIRDRWNTASDKGTRIQRALFKVRKTGQFKITPAILKLLSDRNDGLIADDDVVEILTIMESYWMRRAICALPTNTAGPVCISMLKSLNATNQLKSFKANHKIVLKIPLKYPIASFSSGPSAVRIRDSPCLAPRLIRDKTFLQSATPLALSSVILHW